MVHALAAALRALCRYPRTAAFLRDSGLLQVDMAGFKPTEAHSSVTSLFLHRSFGFKPHTEQQPWLPPGGVHIEHTPWDVFHRAHFKQHQVP